MSRVHIVPTGGTIAMVHQESAGGAVPSLGTAELVDLLSEGAGPVAIDEFCNLPSAHFTLADIWGLRTQIEHLVKQDDVRGVVVTHGTDTMEESAYLADLTVDTAKPIVFTGAMRTASEVGYDGGANLVAAVRVAASDSAEGLGAMVVMNQEVHAARHVVKTHTQSTDTFKSPEYGPLGRVYGDAVVIERRVRRQHIPCPGRVEDVHLIRLAVGMDDIPLRRLLEARAAGVVIESLGGGRVPPWWMPTIRESVEQGMMVVVGSRCSVGRVYDAYGYEGAYRDLQAAGAIFAEGLNGQKARIKLMVALGGGRDRAAIQALFSEGLSEPLHS
ncbi:MAG TPA: asparaginase [Chloroflexi bacterium]|nr:asparaginase [Chloroflexota bacterium]